MLLCASVYACAKKQPRFKGPGHDANWPIEAPEGEAYGAFLKARKYSIAGLVDDAIAAYQKAILHDKNSPSLYVALAEEYTRKNDLVHAEEMALKATGIDEKHRDANFLLGKIYASQGKWEKSETHFKRILTERLDENPDAVLALSSIYVETKRHDEAVSLLGKLLEHDPENLYGFYYLGRVYSEMNMFKEAIASYDKALKVFPGFVSAIKAKALIYEYQGSKKEATIAYQQILRIEPENLHARYRLAQIHLEQSNVDHAREELEVIARQQPNNVTARLKLGLIYIQNEKLDQAEEIFKDLLERTSDKSRVHYYLGVIYEKQSQHTNAIKQFESIEKKSDLYVDARLAIAFLHESEGDMSASEKSLRKGLKQKPGDSRLVIGLANVLVRNEKAQEAENLLVSALAKDENDENLWFALGEVYDKLKNLAKTEEALRRVLEINPDNATALNYLGYTFAEKGINLEEAEKLVRRALEIREKDGFITDSLGWVFFKQGHFQKAVDTLKTANELAPNEPVIMEHYADALQKTGKIHTARETYEKAFALSKDEVEKSRIQQKIRDLVGK